IMSFILPISPPPTSPLFPYTTLFRSEYLGDRAFQKIQIPDELALARMNPTPWLSAIERESILEGKEHLRTAANFGLFANSEALSDRKSTRLNSSHDQSSYAVFCLKKK